MTRLISAPTIFMLIISLGWQPALMADASQRVTGFTAVTTSSPGFTVSSSTRIAWLLEDVNLKEDAPLSGKHTRILLHEEIEAAMQEKGLNVLKSGSPSDYLLAYTIASESTLDDETLLKRYNISPGFNAPTTGNNIYEKGTLLIHIINANTRQTVWQSVVQANIHSKLSDEQRRTNIRAVVRSMLRKLQVVS